MERVVTNLNRALGRVLADDERAVLVGEDLLDPYGGAFKATAGLSTRFPDRVLSTPISEGSLVGMAGGMALCGDRPIVEVMFADFLFLCADQLINFAAKSVSMYGRRVPMPIVVRTPYGGGRGYGPTHSQSPHKHFVGVPDLAVYEMSPFVDNLAVLERMRAEERPCLYFEHKALYARPTGTVDVPDGLFTAAPLPGDPSCTWIRSEVLGDVPDRVLVVPGGMADRAVDAARRAFLDDEVVCEVLVPTRLYPFVPDAMLDVLARAGRVCVVEDGPPGGGWAAEVAHTLHTALWGRLREPVRVVTAVDGVVPAAAHLERRALVDAGTIRDALCGGDR